MVSVAYAGMGSSTHAANSRALAIVCLLGIRFMIAMRSAGLYTNITQCAAPAPQAW